MFKQKMPGLERDVAVQNPAVVQMDRVVRAGGWVGRSWAGLAAGCH